jgi:hypothetical protein
MKDGTPAGPFAGVREHPEGERAPSNGPMVVPFSPEGVVLLPDASACRCASGSRGTGVALGRRNFAGEPEGLAVSSLFFSPFFALCDLGLGFQRVGMLLMGMLFRFSFSTERSSN